jgi:hypothetical protein
MEKQNYVWYACYGSNLNEERFLCYIKGGKPKNSSRIETGCSDKTLPVENRPYILNRPLYFSKNSLHWNNGGSGFIGQFPDKENFTLSRMYLITKEQFIDLVNQENSVTDIKINFEEAIKNGNTKIAETKYGNLLFIEYVDDIPVFSFTCNENSGDSPFVKPDILYLKTILTGLKENYNLSNNEFVDYLIQKPGIKNNFTETELFAGLFE